MSTTTEPRRFTSTQADPRERGVEFGRAHRHDIARTVASYQDLFARRSHPGFDVRRWAGAFRDVIGDLAPDQLAEIQGIADGAGADPLDVVSVNARTEILAKADPRGELECSTVVRVPPHERPFGAQTWDWYDAMRDGWLEWRFPTGDGWIDTVTECGMLAKIGLNHHGVGLFLNILHHEADDNDAIGFPVHLLARRILAEAESVDDAVALARRTPVSASTALTVLDRRTAVGLELFPGGPGLIEPVDGLIVRTNHFLSADGEPGCLTKVDYPSTRIRRQWLQGRLTEHNPKDPNAIVDAMEHHHALGGVCRHPEAQLDPQLRSATLATVKIGGGEIDVAAGGPCGEAGFVEGAA